MLALCLRPFFRKREAFLIVLVLASLVAALTSITSVINSVNYQLEALAKHSSVFDTYLIVSEGSRALSDSEIDVRIVEELRKLQGVKYVIPQRLIEGYLRAEGSSGYFRVRAVEDVGSFLRIKGAHVSGSLPKGEREALAGEILARILGVEVGENVTLRVNDGEVECRIVGVVSSRSELDAELIASPSLIGKLLKNGGKISFVEFSLKDGVDKDALLKEIRNLLSNGGKIVKAQALIEFVENVNGQTLGYLSIWSTAIYAIVVFTSYLLAIKLVTESSYEIELLMALGVSKKQILAYIATYVLIVALISSILGISLGLVGTQVTSTTLRLVAEIDLSPFISVDQCIKVTLLTATSALIGCLYPLLKFVK